MPKVFETDLLSALPQSEVSATTPPPAPLLTGTESIPKLEAPGILESPHDMLLESGHQRPSQPEEDHNDPLRTLVTWKALSRPFKKKDRSFYTTVAILVILFSPIALFLGGMPLFFALAALGFVVYVFNMVAPEDVDYKFSTQGVTIADHFYHWQELDSFWMSQKDGHSVLNILTQFRFPGVLMLTVEPGKEEEVKRVCARFLPFREIVPKTLVEKWAEGLQKHFPLENPHK
ncbi:hypothetical protein A2631_05370 [Candidatus Daviesbacteria bacterium RIFCSPHIGHO2_01_FULL_44_29]|uniref:DUF5673 domain-containing protein n=1 Tax=Candidatus Daviesbacteria bacterium RIFCSPHIGHO2_02_FULL_43_12 TaxID=1797776 RepID=A0A1F5KGS4_9BACT|nr:MAG: hypothetical protein A2631_05370 [Candidatus Daviesbacteria bacterium RIFCSPHIGHO2_01_FULL_44_29]OGE40143.1 MAG: hypothetical protein A3D25_05090 [Candidatus Daviesbacteria bacterium RIFCSPHIGHO2_02_FULL_43_12]OGE70175.1 MAG: hypothetical protein A3B55_00470 [Candidatus Daviesbacteria bacterium RIFCSPLOWO2_01_FULL_43_15]